MIIVIKKRCYTLIEITGYLDIRQNPIKVQFIHLALYSLISLSISIFERYKKPRNTSGRSFF